MGNKCDEYVQERLEGHAFRPHISSQAQRIPTTQAFHRRLHQDGLFTHLERGLHNTMGPKDAEGRMVTDVGFARPSLKREKIGADESFDIPMLAEVKFGQRVESWTHPVREKEVAESQEGGSVDGD